MGIVLLLVAFYVLKKIKSGQWQFLAKIIGKK